MAEPNEGQPVHSQVRVGTTVHDEVCRTVGCSYHRDEEWHLLCARCWYLLSPETRRRVLDEYRRKPRSAAHVKACSDARAEATARLRAEDDKT